ncbi:sugar transferase [Runella zeae]|uniref:sugar transferase n=1 Tax=Runella zeae TaxID=94255 RepID=UPI000423F6A1|nr:sugar transferase [Runella zeae]
MNKFTKDHFSIATDDDFLKENEEVSVLVSYVNKLIPQPAEAYEPLYIFCPPKSIVLIDKVLSEYSLHPVFNNCSRIFRKDETITYYNAAYLNDESREFLLKNIENGVEVMPLVDFLENKNRFTEVSLLNGDYFLTKEDFSVLRNKTKIATKRIFDIIYTLILLVVFAPVMILTAIAIKLESKGPIFYRQRRVGLYNIEFEVIKFRSMATNAEANGAQWASKNDPRVTKVGKFIRKTRIDEMPQLFNILKGEMSLIGPRPERQVFIDMLKTAIPYYEFRHVIKPGLTGWAQVKYPYGASIEDGMWKHKYDMYYIKHQSFWFDFKIILQTVKVVFSGLGR